MAKIQVSHLTFAYPGSADVIFDDVSFQVDTDWKLGFIGRNGRGKTTFLRLLMGSLPNHGAIACSVPFDYFPLSVAAPEKTPLELAEEYIGPEESWRFLREFFSLDMEERLLSQPYASLSGGEKTRVLLALLFAREHRFLLIDEPTNHLDIAGRRCVSRYLNQKKGFILVSHDRAFLDGCVDHILALNKANIEVQKGNFSSWEENKRRQDQFELEENERLKKDIKKMREAAQRMAQWSDAVEATKIGLGPCDRGAIGAKAAKMMRHSKAVETRRARALEEKEGLLKNIEQAEDLKLSSLPHFSDTLVTFRNVSLAYDRRAILTGVNFSLHQGEIAALTGKNGCGKTSVLRLLNGELSPTGGEIRLASGLRISYVPQNAALSGPLKGFIEERGLDETLFKAILLKLDFSREQFEKDMSAYSAGQIKKVLIAGSLCQQAHLYVWDEPLNYIDVMSRVQLERLIARFRPTMLLVEHDETFLAHISARIIAFS